MIPCRIVSKTASTASPCRRGSGGDTRDRGFDTEAMICLNCLTIISQKLMTARTLYDKLWDSHVVHVEPDGTALLYIDRHLVHEVTSPQAFEGLKLAGRKPWRMSSVV